MSDAMGEQADVAVQRERAAQRFADAAPQRERAREHRQLTGRRVVDTAEQLSARVRHRYGDDPAVAAVLTRAALAGDGVLERVLGPNQMQGSEFLTRAARASATVGRLTVRRNGQIAGYGTGFLVGERLLMTNHHVFPDLDVAAGSFVEFDVELTEDGVPRTPVVHTVDAATLFVTDDDLDMTLVALHPGADGRTAGSRQGWNRLIARQGKLVVGEAANIIGHPEGRPKQIAIRENDLLDQHGDVLHYRTDTKQGDSGSPVFNDQWEVVGLHHMGVRRTDGAGRVLAVGGAVWDPSMGDDAVDWIANEGIRISAILALLAAWDGPAAQRAVLDELGPQAVPEDREALRVTRAVTDGVGTVERELASPGVRPAVEAPPHLVFLHGRSQQDRDPALLRAHWAGGLARGLAAAGRAPIDPNHVWFPYYGDLLAELAGPDAVESASLDPTVADSVAVRCAPRDPSARSTYAALVTEAATAAGYPGHTAPAATEAWGDVVAALAPQLSWLAAWSPLDDLAIALRFRDVALYLDAPEVRERILAAVLSCAPSSGAMTLVSHSLGTIVALDLTERLPAAVDLRLLVTAGSPLGMDTVNKRLLLGGPRRPDRVGRWVNAWCAADAVAIGSPLEPVWGRVDDVETDNPREHPHDIVAYLADSRVATAIGSG